MKGSTIGTKTLFYTVAVVYANIFIASMVVVGTAGSSNIQFIVLISTWAGLTFLLPAVLLISNYLCAPVDIDSFSYVYSPLQSRGTDAQHPAIVPALKMNSHSNSVGHNVAMNPVESFQLRGMFNGVHV